MTQKQLPATQDKSMMFRAFPANTDAGDRKAISIEAARALISWAAKYGLDAWANHACYMYGKPYVTEKGALANALGGKGYKGFTWRKLKGEELQELGAPDSVACWECSVFVEGYPNPIVEIGEVTQSELDTLRNRIRWSIAKEQSAERHSDQDIEAMTDDRLMYLPLWRTPSTMARARAIRRAHLLAFPLKGYVEPELREAASASNLSTESLVDPGDVGG